MAARGKEGLADLSALCRRTQVPRRLVRHLVQAGACDGWGVARRRLLWELAALRYDERELDLPAAPDEVQPPLTEAQEGGWEQSWGLSATPHLLGYWRVDLHERGYTRSDALGDLPDGARVRVAGQLIVHQAPPTA